MSTVSLWWCYCRGNSPTGGNNEANAEGNSDASWRSLINCINDFRDRLTHRSTVDHVALDNPNLHGVPSNFPNDSSPDILNAGSSTTANEAASLLNTGTRPRRYGSTRFSIEVNVDFKCQSNITELQFASFHRMRTTNLELWRRSVLVESLVRELPSSTDAPHQRLRIAIPSSGLRSQTSSTSHCRSHFRPTSLKKEWKRCPSMLAHIRLRRLCQSIPLPLPIISSHRTKDMDYFGTTICHIFICETIFF